MGVFQQYETNTEAENEGVWVTLYPGFEVKIARLGNRDYQRAYQRLIRPHRQASIAGSLDPEIQKDIGRKASADHVFLDFRGDEAVDKQGQRLENTRENRIRLLEMDDFADDIASLASSRELFRQEQLEAEAGN